jgi:hypothetical protein
MKQPLQAILFPAEAETWISVLNGNKAVTIREGERDYHTGSVILCSFEKASLCVMADVEYVHHSRARDVPVKDFKDDGYTSRKQMLEDLQMFYPNLTQESPVTVVRWSNVRGRLRDYWLEGANIHKFIANALK